MQEDNNGGRTQIYELGYHIAPRVIESDLPQEVNSLHNNIEENKGIIISEEFPKIRPLSYPIAVMVNGRKQQYENAYFGWIKFEIGSSEIGKVKKWMEGNPSVLRYLLIKTVRENTIYAPRLAQTAKMQGGIESKKDKAEKPAVKMTTEEIDKTIDEMVKE